MRPLDPAVAAWRQEWAALGLEVTRFGDERGDATVVAAPAPAPALLHDVWTHPDHRRAGVAGELVREVCAWADARGRTVMLVAAEEAGTIDLPVLVAFYERHGFRVTGWMTPADVVGGDAAEELVRRMGGYADPRPVMTRYPQPPAEAGKPTGGAVASPPTTG